MFVDKAACLEDTQVTALLLASRAGEGLSDPPPPKQLARPLSRSLFLSFSLRIHPSGTLGMVCAALFASFAAPYSYSTQVTSSHDCQSADE